MRIATIGLLTACSSSGSSPPEQRLGTVAIASFTHFDPADEAGAAGAQFLVAEPAAPPAIFETCEVSQWPTHVPVDPVPHAGDITFRGTTPTSMTIEPQRDGRYLGTSQPQHAFAAGAHLNVTAAGSDDIPAFGVSLTAPGQAAVVTPVEAGGQNLVVPVAEDLVTTWTGGSGLLEIVLDDVRGNTVTCRFPAADGSGTIPHAALGVFRAGTSGSISIETVDRVETQAGEWRIDVVARFPARPAGDRAIIIVRFQ